MDKQRPAFSLHTSEVLDDKGVVFLVNFTIIDPEASNTSGQRFIGADGTIDEIHESVFQTFRKVQQRFNDRKERKSAL